MKSGRLVSLFPFAGLALCLGCVEPETDDPIADADTGDVETGSETGDGDGDPGEPDSDGDGLTDVEEEQLGTDPNNVDTDDDTYWDSWEVIEDTDPLDYESRIYRGFWPYKVDKDLLEQGSWETASHALESLFPRATFVDQYGEAVDLYDFADYSDNPAGTAAYFIIDVAAQWCGPCHDVGDWIAGVANPNSASLDAAYPTVRAKIHDGRAFWVTFIVQNANGGEPTLADSETWFGMHPDERVPVLVDEGQRIQAEYGSNQFPFFFLLDPFMAVEFWAPPSANEDPFFPLALVDQYL